MKGLIAQYINIAPNNGFTGLGNGPLANPGSGAVSVFANFISAIIGILTIVAIVWAVFSLLSGAIGIISSGGDKGKLEDAKKKITSGIIGLIIVIVALAIIGLVGTFLGLPNILNISGLFNLIK